MNINASISFGAPNSTFAGAHKISPFLWTCLGALAIPLWATWPALSLQMRDMPSFECLTLAFLAGWLALLVLQPVPKRSDTDSASWVEWRPALMFALAECGSAGFFLVAQRYISAAEANLIIYLWPGMVVAGAAALGLARMRLRHMLGVTVGFAGAAVLVWGGSLSLSFVGIGFALAGGGSWAAYCIYRMKWPEARTGFLSRGCAIATIICGGLHLALETSVLPSLTSAAAALVTGIFPTAIATIAWDKGIRSGDGRLLAVMAYGTPLCSALLLGALGLESLTWKLALGAIGIVSAGILSGTDAPETHP